jgi:tRNA A37 methylthiotransferase MiaB
VLAEAHWLAEHGVRELVLVSENSTSYGKDLGDLRLLETLLPELTQVPGIERVRLSYLQPAEMRPGLVAVLTGTPGVAPYFDMSFQHSSATVLRRMRRFGSTETFLALLDQIRAGDPTAAVRSNVIVGFPGETEDDVAELERFLIAARLDAVGVFGYSDEDGTEAESLPTTCRSPSSTSASPGSPPWSRSSPPSAPRSGTASWSRSWSTRSSAVSKGARPGRRPRWTARRR